MDKKQLVALLKKQELCVIATASGDGKPESAVMAYVIREDGLFLMSTEENTRKYQNMLVNNKVSLVVGGLKGDPTVQVDGEFTPLEGEKAKEAKRHMLATHPEWKGYFDSPNSRFFAITPSWTRYSDFSKEPPEIVEIKDFS